MTAHRGRRIERMLWDLLPANGSPVGNARLLHALRAAGDAEGLGIEDDDFQAARQSLLDAARVVKGRGRGGATARAPGSGEPAAYAEIPAASVAEQRPNFELQPQATQPDLLDEARRKPAPAVTGRAPRAAPQSGAPQVLSYRHADRRANNPEVGLVSETSDPAQPKTTWAYDPHLDPVLQWAGKAERASFEVDTVSLHVHERIDPMSILAAVSRSRQDKAARGKPHGGIQPGLFEAPFENLPLRDAVDFYRHDKGWSNRLVAGDSLLGMNSLLVKEGLAGQVQMIYIDPPYGIRYGSNFQPFVNKRDVKDRADADLTAEPEMIKAFRDTWELGIHSYLTYLRDRLLLARELLNETGSVFVQISDENLHLVRQLVQEVFGLDNAMPLIVFRKTSGAGSPSCYVEGLPQTCDFLLWFAKARRLLKMNRLYLPKAFEDDANFAFVQEASLRRRALSRSESPKTLADGSRLFRFNPTTSQSGGETTTFGMRYQDLEFRPSKGGWKTNASGLLRLAKANRLGSSGNTLSYVRFADDFGLQPVIDIWDDTRQSGFGDAKIYAVQTAQRVVERCLLMTTAPGDLVLDPTCGSGTTAYVAEQWGRRWITCDTSRVALALARTRLMAAEYPYYLLADSSEGIKKEAELTGTLTPALSQEARGNMEGDIKRGFVYKRVPHVTLKSIANNPDIKEGLTREQIDAAIARHADTETLFDQPYEDNKRVRVCGPFSVESLSPHRVLSTADENQDGTVSEQEGRRQQDFATMILDNLRKAGVQNTRKSERLTFDRLDPYAGAWLHAAGEYTDADGKTRRVAISIGPEHGTVGPQQVKEAAKEAVQGVGYDILAVCGFAFDPHVAEEVKRYGKLTVLPAKMNPDLTMGDEQ